MTLRLYEFILCGTRTRPLFLIDWLRQSTIIGGRVCHVHPGVHMTVPSCHARLGLSSRERSGPDASPQTGLVIEHPMRT